METHSLLLARINRAIATGGGEDDIAECAKRFLELERERKMPATPASTGTSNS
jgi:hypothetical protein